MTAREKALEEALMANALLTADADGQPCWCNERVGMGRGAPVGHEPWCLQARAALAMPVEEETGLRARVLALLDRCRAGEGPNWRDSDTPDAAAYWVGVAKGQYGRGEPEITEEEIAELERLDRAATPGPWETETITDELDDDDEQQGFAIRMRDAINSRGRHDVNHLIECDWSLDVGTRQHAEASATVKLIASVRNALPRLLAELRRLRGSP